MSEQDSVYNNHLKELKGSGYEIIDGEPDITGWDVVNDERQKIGEVTDLLFNPETGSVRYVIIDLEENELGLDAGKKILVPIGIAQLHGNTISDDINTGATGSDLNGTNEVHSTVTGNEDDIDDDSDLEEDDEFVLLPHVTAAQLSALPAYKTDELSAGTESTTRNIFEGAGIAGIAGGNDRQDNYYAHEHFNENKFYDKRNPSASSLPVIEEELNIGKQEVQTGGARLTSRIVDRPVEENINLRQEHVSIVRTPVSRPVSSSDFNAFQEEEIEMTEHAEIPVVSKEARVVEEVSLTKVVSEKEETIRDTVRNTEVDIEQLPGRETEGYTESGKV